MFRNSNLHAPSNKSTWEVLVLTDADFRILIVNPGWESLTGLKIHETIGNSLFELCCKNDDDGWKNSSESFEFAVRAAVRRVEVRIVVVGFPLPKQVPKVLGKKCGSRLGYDFRRFWMGV